MQAQEAAAQAALRREEQEALELRKQVRRKRVRRSVVDALRERVPRQAPQVAPSRQAVQRQAVAQGQAPVALTAKRIVQAVRRGSSDFRTNTSLLRRGSWARRCDETVQT